MSRYVKIMQVEPTEGRGHRFDPRPTKSVDGRTNAVSAPFRVRAIGPNQSCRARHFLFNINNLEFYGLGWCPRWCPGHAGDTAVIRVLVNAFLAAQLSNTGFAAKALQHNPDLFFC